MAKVAMMATTTGTTTTNVGASDTETEQTPPNPTIFRDFLSGTAATVHGTQPSASSPPAADRQMGSLIERISCFGPRNDHSKAEISNQLAGSKRSNSASVFMCSSREAFHQTNPESSHAMKILCKASGRERLIGTGHETSLHGAPQTRLFSSFMSRPTGNMPNLPQSERQYTSCIAQSSVSYQIPPSRFRDGSSGPPVLSELASDEGSQTGNKGSGILNSINASKVITERRPLTLLPNGGKPPSHSADPESSNIPSQRGVASIGRPMTIIYAGQVHVFDGVHPNQADVIMDLAGSSGLSWSTNLHQSLAMATRSDNCLPGGANETSIAVYPSFTQKYDNIVSVGRSPIGRIGSGNQGVLITKDAGTPGQAAESSWDPKYEV